MSAFQNLDPNQDFTTFQSPQYIIGQIFFKTKTSAMATKYLSTELLKQGTNLEGNNCSKEFLITTIYYL